MKKYVLLLIAVLSGLISVTGLANSSSVSTPSLEATVKMFKPENQSLAREFLTTVKSEKENIQDIANLINKEFGRELLYVGEHKGEVVLSKNDNVDLANVTEAQKMRNLKDGLKKALNEQYELISKNDKETKKKFSTKIAYTIMANTKLTHKFRDELK